MKAFVSWSGGKESSLACYRAMQTENIAVNYLLNMIAEDGKHSRSHGISSIILQLQAEAMKIPIVQRKTSWKNYEREFKKAVSDLRKEGVEIGVFGDIDLQEHRDWAERVCKEAGIKSILPLWGKKREKLLEELITVGFKAIIVATKDKFLGKRWLGQPVDLELIKKLKVLGGIDLCGENGEYHTLVYDGPIFKKPVEFELGKKYLKEGYWFLEIICASRKFPPRRLV